VPATKNGEAGILPRFGGWHHFQSDRRAATATALLDHRQHTGDEREGAATRSGVDLGDGRNAAAISDRNGTTGDGVNSSGLNCNIAIVVSRDCQPSEVGTGYESIVRVVRELPSKLRYLTP